MTRSARASFELWLTRNGAEPLGLKQNEFARFRAQGVLCIVYEPNRKGRQACVPELAKEAFDAWCAMRPMDLANPEDVEVEDWHAMGIALAAIATRVKAGEEIDLPEEAGKLGISERRLVRALRAHGAIIPEFA